jgi:hypothetical protein
MGILDRYPDWKEKDKEGKVHYRREQPSYGNVLPSLMKLKTKEHFYQKTIFKMFLIVVFLLLILYYLLPNLF